MKTSTQWDVIGISAALLTFVSFFVFMYCGPLHGANTWLIGFGNPFLMLFYLVLSFLSFICGYVESSKDELGASDGNEIVFINVSNW